MKIFLILLSTMVLFIGCNKHNEVEPTEEQKLWVSHLYSGGIQCDTSVSYKPPDVVVVLGEVGIIVFDTKIEGYAVCAACGCPTYAAMHYALIRAIDLSKANNLGFTQKDPPK